MGYFCQKCNSGADTSDGPIRPLSCSNNKRDIYNINAQNIKETAPSSQNSGVSTA